MIDDTHQMFSDISRALVTINQQVHDIQIHQFVRDFSQPWARNLRFVSVPGTLDQASGTALTNEENAGRPTEEDAETDSDVSDISRPPMIGIPSRSACCCRQKPCFPVEGLSELQITTKDPPEMADCKHYVAISYCWKSQEGETPKYLVQTAKGQRPNEAPSVILSRAVAFAAYHNLGLVWIDQECIEQEDREDKEQGIQSMDLVYQQASHAVALLTVRITSQAYVDALSKLVQGEELTPSELVDAVEALELIAADRWLERAWCFQETAAAGESLRLLIPCDLEFTGDEGFYSIPGEIEMTVREIQAGAAWVTACADGVDPALIAARVASDLKVRAERVFNTLMEMCPIAYHTEPRDPEFRFGCNASEALQLLGDRQNRRLEDRLAILANVCNYATRLNTHNLKESEERMGREHSFSLCFLVLALLNGDMSLIFCSRLQVERQRQLENYQDSNRNPQIPVWMLLGDTKLRDLPCIQESHGLQFRLPRPSFDSGSLVILGHFWIVDQSVNLRKIQKRFASALNDEVISESPVQLEYELLWSILCELWNSDLHILADRLWHRVRHDEILPVPAILSRVIDCTTGSLDVPFSRLMELGEGEYQLLPQRLLHPGGPRHLAWMGQRTIAKGSLWCGRRVFGSREHWTRSKTSSEVLSVFDCDGPVTVLTPHNEQLEIWRRSIYLDVVSNPLTWIVKKTGRASKVGEVLKCHEFVRGVWSSDARTSKRYVLE